MRTTRVTVLVLAVFAIVLASTSGCQSSEPRCRDGELVGCRCGEATGYAECVGGAPATCVCSTDGGPTGPSDAAPVGTADATVDARDAGAGFLATCTTNEECETGLCHLFNAKGRLCTKPCASPQDCPLPSTGCNNQGVCKAP